jgi:hypothetical protein
MGKRDGEALAAAKRRVGRPSVYDPAVADIIIEQMAGGRDLRDVLSDAGMPSVTSVYRWMDDEPQFGSRVARAREALADHIFYEIELLQRNVTPETANADRVRLSAMQFRAARLAPKKYGDRVQSEVTSNVTLNTSNVDASELDADQRDALRAALAAAATQAAPKPH